MKISKDAKGMGMPWEAEYGYAQAVKVGDTIYVSGQLSHDDEGNFVGAAPLDDQGRIRDHSNMEIQMRNVCQRKETPRAVWRHLGQCGRGSPICYRHGCSVCRGRTSEKGGLRLGQTGRCKHHPCDSALGVASAAHRDQVHR